MQHHAADLANATYGALGVLDGTGTRLAQFIAIGIDEEAPPGHRPPPRRTRHPRTAHRRRQAIAPARPAEHPTASDSRPTIHRCDRSLASRCACAMRCSGTSPHRQGRGRRLHRVDEELIVALAGAAGVAIENARLRPAARHGARRGSGTHRPRPPRHRHPAAVRHRDVAAEHDRDGAFGRPGGLDRIERAVDDLDVTIKDIRTAIFGLEQTRADESRLRSRVPGDVAAGTPPSLDRLRATLSCSRGRSTLTVGTTGGERAARHDAGGAEQRGPTTPTPAASTSRWRSAGMFACGRRRHRSAGRAAGFWSRSPQHGAA